MSIKGERVALEGGVSRAVYSCTCGCEVVVDERNDDGSYTEYESDVGEFFAAHAACPSEEGQ